MEYYLKAVRDNYTNFKGRAGRKDYWYFVLWNVIFSMCTAFLDIILGLAGDLSSTGPINIIYGLIILLPSIAVFVRRMHDVGKSGWWYFMWLLPIIGWIWVLILLCRESDGPNQYDTI